MEKRFTFSVFTENSPGVLHRITTFFTRRRINIESLTVSETEVHALSRFTIVANVAETLAPVIVKQIGRIIEVHEVHALEDEALIHREIALFRVSAASNEERAAVERAAKDHGAAVIAVNHVAVVVEASGTEDETQQLYKVLEPFGIQEFLRSGRIALSKIPQVRERAQLALPLENRGTQEGLN